MFDMRILFYSAIKDVISPVTVVYNEPTLLLCCWGHVRDAMWRQQSTIAVVHSLAEIHT